MSLKSHPHGHLALQLLDSHERVSFLQVRLSDDFLSRKQLLRDLLHLCEQGMQGGIMTDAFIDSLYSIFSASQSFKQSCFSSSVRSHHMPPIILPISHNFRSELEAFTFCYVSCQAISGFAGGSGGFGNRNIGGCHDLTVGARVPAQPAVVPGERTVWIVTHKPWCAGHLCGRTWGGRWGRRWPS